MSLRQSFVYPAARYETCSCVSKLLELSGKFFHRIDFDIPESGLSQVCVQLPAARLYSMAVVHDRNADGKLTVLDKGFGFPGNPKLGMKKPNVNQAIFISGPCQPELDIVLNYWNGFGASPIKKKL